MKKLDGIKILNYILENIENSNNTYSIPYNKDNVDKLELIDKDDMHDIIFNTKTFLFNVWKMNLTNSFNNNIKIDFNKIDIEDLFYFFFSSKEEFLEYYKIYKKRMYIKKTINRVFNNIVYS